MDVLAAHATRAPGALAVVDGERRWTWAAWVADRNRLADALRARGVGPGAHVALLLENSAEFLLAAAAARALGAIAVPVSHRLAPAELAYILDHAEPAAVVVGAPFAGAVEALQAGRPRVRVWALIGEARPWGCAFAALLAEGRPDAELPAAALPAGGSMIYTSGTTGRPKGALRLTSDPAVTLERLRPFGLVEPGHVHLVAGPLYHSAPLAFATAAHLFGGGVVVMPRFDAEAALALIARHGVTSTFMAPTLLKRLVDLPGAVAARWDTTSLRVIVVAAAPCPMAVKEGILERFGPVLYEFYGSTELGINTVLLPGDVLRKPGSCGRAAPGVELAVLDDAGAPVVPGVPGELHVRRGPATFDGYFKDAAAEAAAGEWLSVGDVAWMDAEGFVYICDRKRDMIISGGVNIYPAEIEDALHRHPAIADAAVFGVPDDAWGERVHAAVELRPDAALTAEELVAFARTWLGGYKVPREVSFHASLPRDQAGKLLKRVLRDPFWAGRPTRV